MSTYISGYQHDVFVSYAHLDNEPLVGSDKGWVTTLITELKKLLGQKLGRADAYSLWMDYKLRGNQLVTPDIEAQLKNTATFLLILSPGYLASKWCVLEYTTFLQQVGASAGRIFMVEKDFIEREQKPLEFQELLGYQFWGRHADTGRVRTLGIPKPNPEREPEYYQKLDDLATELASTLNRLKTQTMMESNSSELEQSSALQRRLRKTRLQHEKTRLEANQAQLIQQYEALAAKLPTTVDAANQAILNNQLRQLEQQAESLEREIAKLDSELKN